MNSAKKRNVFKKVTALAMCAMMAVSSCGISASAANKEFSFSVKTSSNGGKQFTTISKKDDNEQRAYVTTKRSNLIKMIYFTTLFGKTALR